MQPYFERVRQRLTVTSTPSPDGVAENVGPAAIVHPLYASAGYVEGDTSMPFTAKAIYGRPFVAVRDGMRAGPISGWFEEVAPRGVPIVGLEILSYAKVDRLTVDAATGEASAVEYTSRGALDQSLPGAKGVATLKRGGLVVMAAGALATARLLLLSGIGPKGREAEMFPGRASPPAFTIDNGMVGVGVFDHVMSMVTYRYDGTLPYTAYEYGDATANAPDIARYLSAHQGPCAQYQPVSILNYARGSDVPNVEIFLNPNGAGPAGGPYRGAKMLSAFVMLLDPKARGIVALDEKNQAAYPKIHLPDTPEGEADKALMADGEEENLAGSVGQAPLVQG